MKKKELEKSIGKKYVFFCMNYIYAGNISVIREDSVGLENAGIVYETGPFEDRKWKDFQSLNTPLFDISYNSMESYGETTKE